MLNTVYELLGMPTLDPTGKRRSSKWAAVRKAQLKRQPTCEVCGTRSDLDVHHVVPFHVDPSLELVASNLQTVCTRCHCFVCHLGSWASWNAECRADAAIWLRKIQSRPGGPAPSTPPPLP